MALRETIAENGISAHDIRLFKSFKKWKKSIKQCKHVAFSISYHNMNSLVQHYLNGTNSNVSKSKAREIVRYWAQYIMIRTMRVCVNKGGVKSIIQNS